MEPEIIYKDDDIIVAYKPAGLATQTKSVSEQDLYTKLRNILKDAGEMDEIFVVHRLDQPVEGLVVFGRNKAAASNLSKQISEHFFNKKYYAVISRESFPEDGILEDYMVKDMRTNMSKIVTDKNPRGKYAKLSYRTVSSWDDKKLLDITLFTGRHHQIRLQLASRTAPIVGDVKYGGPSTGRPIALCSYAISFEHPVTGEVKSFNIIPKGDDFKECTLFK